MKTEVSLERLSDKRYRVTGAAPFAISVEGESREDALSRFKEAAFPNIAPVSEVVTIDIPVTAKEKAAALPTEDPWASFAGWLKDDPLQALYLEAIAENRRIDEENERRKMEEEEALAEAVKKASLK